MKMLDLFSGIGGFHKGFEEVGFEFDWVGFSEIDKYASAVYKYRYPDAEELGDVAAIRPERDLPDNIDLLCGGFPCQAFSVAGRRKGFEDTRGTLFFEIARILRHFRDTEKPIPYFVLENVKGLLSHDDGRTFAIIYRVLTDIGYTVECQLLNTRWVLPQNRERIYIVGHIGRGSGCKVFPIGESGGVSYNRNTEVASTLQHPGHSGGNYKGMNMIDTGLKQIGVIGKDTIATRVYDTSGISTTLTDGGGMGAKTGLYQVKAVLTPDRKEKRQIGRKMKEDGEPMFTLNAQDQHGVMVREATKKGYAEAKVGDSINLSVPNSKTRRGRVGKGEAQTLDTGMQQYTIDKTAIRRLTPIECMRLQGFPDDWNEKGMIDGKEVNMSDTQRYKQAGNAVSVPIVSMVAERIKDASN
jgi:DNA (cytosine-5)-methyltransferase 1